MTWCIDCLKTLKDPGSKRCRACYRASRRKPAREIRVERRPGSPPLPPPCPLSCSFCGKAQREVEALIAGPTVYICNECVDLCVSIVLEKKADAILQGAGHALVYSDFVIPGLAR